MVLRVDYADGGATPVPGNITASDMNAISTAVNAGATLTGTETLTNKTLTAPKMLDVFDSNGNTVLYLPGTSSAVNYMQLTNAATGSPPAFNANGTDTDIGISFVPKGNGHLDAWARDKTSLSFIVSGNPTDVDWNFVTKGAGVVKANNVPVATTTATQTLTNKTLTAPKMLDVFDSNGNTVLYLPGAASAVNYMQLTNAAAGGSPAFNSNGSDTDIGMSFVPKGNGHMEAWARDKTSMSWIVNGTQTDIHWNLETKGAGVVKADGVEVATISGTQTLTSKTLTSPSIGGTPVFTTGIPAANLPNGLTNGNVARQSQTAATNTSYYITSSNLTLPATLKAGMAVGSKFVWRVAMDKTAVGTGTFSMIIYRGVNGSTSDTADVTQSFGTQTAAVDSMVVDVVVTVTTTGASGAYYWTIIPVSEAITATGFGCVTGPSGFFSGTVSTVAMNTTSLIFGLGFRNGATGTPVITVPMVQAQALNIC